MGPVADRVFVFVTLGGLTAWVLLGWRAWVQRRPPTLNAGMIFSLVGFCFASFSAALDISSGIYAQFREGGFPFNDPTLLRIYYFGFWSALLGLLCGLIGIVERTPLRFKAPTLSLVMVLLWIAQDLSE